MDVIDEAQARTEHYQRLAMQNRAFDLPPVPPSKTNSLGEALCIDCDTNIQTRRRVVANAQCCAECQQDRDRIIENRRGK